MPNQHVSYFSFAANFTKLMVIGGQLEVNLPKRDVEVIDLSGNGQTCTKPEDFPLSYATKGVYFNGSPFVCGGYSSGWSKDCYNYNAQVHALFFSSYHT